MEESAWDLTELAEEDFEQLAVYIVPDAEVGPSSALNRSEASLPRNLVLKSSQALSDVLGVWSSDYIPRGTRFGPLVGNIYAKDNVPKHANRKYFWRVRQSLSIFNCSLITVRVIWDRVWPILTYVCQNLCSRFACLYQLFDSFFFKSGFIFSHPFYTIAIVAYFILEFKCPGYFHNMQHVV